MTSVLMVAVMAGMAGQGQAMKPFVMNHREGGASIADVSFLHDGPAGKDGFIQVKGGHFVKPDGKRIRFWGVHLTDWSRGSILLPPKEDIPMWAGTLARYGVNIVRLHFLDLPSPRGIIDGSRDDSQSFDRTQLDRLDFMVFNLKQRGIYVDLNLNVGRSYKAGDGVRDFARIGWAKGLIYYDPRLIELQKDYAKKILTHVNPYTKEAYRDEPGVAIVEIANENAIYMGFQAPTPYYETELTGIYNAWLAKNLKPAEVSKLREIAGVKEEDPVPRLRGPEVGSAPRERYATELRFYMDLEGGFYRDMRTYLRKELGVKSAIIGTADHSHTSSPYTMLASLSQLDALDGHVYWEHPGSRVMNTPMVNDPLNSTIVQLSRTAFAGKPYTVSETNHPFPNDYASEGIPIMAAYAAFQDWDMVIFYTFEPKLDPNWKPYVGDPFDISLDPVRMTQLASGALTFLQSDVRPAKKVVKRSYSNEQVLDSRRLPGTEQPYFTPGFPLALPLIHGSRIQTLSGRPTGKFDVPSTQPIVSDTNELTWYASGKTGGMVTVDTDRSQSLIGFIKANPKSLKNLSADIANDFAAITLASMDSKPISWSSKMLLTTGSRVENTGMRWNANRTRVLDSGGPPSQIEPVSGKIMLSNLRGAKGVTATPLDGAGRPIGDGNQGTKEPDGWSFAIGDPATTWYVVTVRR